MGELLIILVIAVPVLAFYLSTTPENPVLRMIGQLIFIALMLGFGYAAYFCLTLPFKGNDTGFAFFMWIPGLASAFIAAYCFSFWRKVSGTRKIMQLPETKREGATLEMSAELIKEFEEEIRVKSKEAQSFWLAPGKRSELRKEIAQAEKMIELLGHGRGNLVEKVEKESAINKPE